MTNERLRRGEVDDEERRRTASEVIDRRALQIFERYRCSWIEAWTAALEEQRDLDDERGGAAAVQSRLPRRGRHAGRVTLSEQIGVERRTRVGPVPPGRATRSSTRIAPVMRSAEHTAAVDSREIDRSTAELVSRASHGGAELDAELRRLLEQALGVSLRDVRVHTGSNADAAARALGARAFAVGDDVFFRHGAYAPQQRDGQRLIAHEVAHTVQARGGGDAGGTVSQPDDAPEREADAFADSFVRDLGPQGGAAPIKHEPLRPTAGRIFLDRDSSTPAGGKPAPASAPGVGGPAPASPASPATTAPATPASAAEPLPAPSSPVTPSVAAAAPAAGGAPATGGAPSSTVAAGSQAAPPGHGADTSHVDHAVAAPGGVGPAPTGSPVEPTTTGPANATSALAAPAPASVGAAIPDGPGFEGTRAVLAQIDAAAATARAQLQQQIERGAGEIAATVLAQTNAIATASAAQKAQIRASFAQAKADIAAAVTEATAKIDADAATQKAALASWHAGAIAGNTATFDDGQKRARKSGTDGGQRASAAADGAADQVADKMKDAAGKASAVGQQKASTAGGKPETKDAKTKAASKIATDAAAKINDGRDKLVGKLRGMAPSTANQLRHKGEEAAATIASGASQVLTHYASIHSTTDAAIDQLASKSRQDLTKTTAQVSGSLEAQEQKTLAAIDHRAAMASADLQRAGRDATVAYHKQGAASLQAGDSAITALKSKIAPQRIDARHAGNAGTLATTALGQAFQQITAKAREPIEHVKSQLTTTGQQTVTALSQTSQQVATQVHGTVDKVRGEATKASGSVGSKLKAAVTGARDAGTAADQQVKTGIDAQVGVVDKAVTKGLADLQVGLDAKVTEGEQKAREPLAQVGPKIDEAHAKIDRDADKGAIGKALSWIGDQLSQLGKMLLDPGFWVGLLVVGVALFFLPEELTGLALLAVMAGIGALAAGLGTIVSNLWNGRSWHQDLLQNILVGAVFGVALTGVGLWLGTGVVGIAGMMVTAGILTVVVNLIEGKPLDEGLLANMLLVGLFAGIAKFFGKLPGLKVDPNTKPPDLNPPKPGDPNPPKPADPNPPKPADPNAPPQPGDPNAPPPADPTTPPQPADPNAPPQPVDPNAPPQPVDPNAPPQPADPNAPPEPVDPNEPQPKPSKEAEFRAEAAEKQKSFAKGEAKKQSDKFDFSRDPEAAPEVEKSYRDAFSDEYVKQRLADQDAKAAQTAAKKVASAKANEVAKARAGSPLNIETAQLRAHGDVESGKAFKDDNQLGQDTVNAKTAYEAGTQGEAAKTLSPQLAGKTVPEMEALLDADAAAGKSTRQPDSVTAGKPQHSWLYPDGTLVRIKPQGDAFGNDPTYSVEVNKQPGGPSTSQDDVAFKVGADGKPVPKGPSDINNPYKKDVNPAQNKAYEQQVIEEGHLKAKQEPPQPPPP